MGIAQFPAAAAGPTLGEITTAIQNNTSPWGANWVNIASSTSNTVNSVVFSGLSGYKYYRLIFTSENLSGQAATFLRLNGDTAGNYNYWWNAPGSSPAGNAIKGDTSIVVAGNIGGARGSTIDLFAANSTSADKLVTHSGAVGNNGMIGGGIWSSTAAITSITLFHGSSATGNWSARLFGAN